METAPGLVGQPATVIARCVQRGEVPPTEVVGAHLDQIAALNGRIGAFVLVRADKALAEARALASRPDLADLPLAGVPIAVKDNLPVAGEPTRHGMMATSDTPSQEDHETVRRLRAAGAIVVGKTSLPEAGLWGTTDGAFGVTRNPWDLARTAGGSSGGSAAAVAAAMVPVALGNDGLGSIRIPAAACGLVGVKPGEGVVPSGLGENDWFGLTEHGPLATTVDDAALMLSVLADRPDLRTPLEPPRSLRIAVSTRPPLSGARLDSEWRIAAGQIARLLAEAGHRVRPTDPPYSLKYACAIVARWFAAAAATNETVNPRELQPRTRRHAAAGRVVQRLSLVKPDHREEWRRRLEFFFADFDLLLTPALARPPVSAGPWMKRSWLANVFVNTTYAPYAAAWNLAGYPAAVVPAGLHSCGTPLAVQLVAPTGGEALILAVARQIEQLSPWRRHAPLAGQSSG